MSKHTPGPWRLHVVKPKEVSPGFFITETLTGAAHYGDYYLAVVGADGTVVADNGDYYPQPISLEDARLIAAVPEMLKMLRKCYQRLKAKDADIAEEVGKCIDKALGEQP